MLKNHAEEIKKQHQQFVEQLQQHLNVEEIHKDFSNLRKLNEVVEQLKRLTHDPVKAEELSKKLRDIQAEIAKIEITESKSGLGSLFGGSSANTEEVRKLRGDNIRLQSDVDRLTRQVTKLLTERQSAPATPKEVDAHSHTQDSIPNTEEKPTEDTNKGGWWPFGKRN